MKRLILFVMTIFLIFALTGCDLFNKEEKDAELARVEAREDAREFILEIIDRFGAVEDEDLEYPEDEDQYVLGNIKMVMAMDDDSINLVLHEDGVFVMLEFVLDESTRQTMKIWNVMITYTDTNEEIYIYLDYYHYGKLFVDDYAGEDFDVGYKSFADQLYLLELEDIIWILNELGYNEVADTQELSFEDTLRGLYWR